MQTIFLKNDKDRSVTVAVEPWAWVKNLSPGERMAIDYADLVDREIEITLQQDGSAFLSIPADGIRVRTVGKPFESGAVLPPAPVIPDGLSIERLFPKNAESLFGGDEATKNPPQD